MAPPEADMNTSGGTSLAAFATHAVMMIAAVVGFA